MTTPLDAALSYLAKGWSVIPILAGTKRPPLPWKDFQTRRATVEEVREWFTRWPDAGVAIVCGAVSGLVVVDRDGDAGAENLTVRGITYPDTPRVRTRRGEHVYFAHPGHPVESRANPDNDRVRAAHPTLAGLDWKGDGGYVLAAPTVHPEGPVYAWDVTPDAAPLAPLPEWFWEMYAEAHEDRGARVAPAPPPAWDADDARPWDDDEPHGGGEEPPAVETLADSFDKLRTPLPPWVAGVPTPDWTNFRAVLAGVKQSDLDAAGGENPDLTAYNRVEAAARRGSYWPAGLHMVTGFTGGGKSAFLMNAVHAALMAGHPVVYVSLELNALELAARIVARTGHANGTLHVPSWALLAQRAERSPEQAAALETILASLAPVAHLFRPIVPEGGVDFGAIETAALSAWRETGKAPLVCFDYLQASAMVAGVDRVLALREYISEVTMKLRRLTLDKPDQRYAPDSDITWHGCPALVLSTTARSNVTGENAVLDAAKPDAIQKADLEALKALPKEAGEIETTAVTAWVIALGWEERADGTRAMAMRCAKQRYTTVGAWVPFAFDGRTGTMTEERSRYGALVTENGAAVRAGARADRAALDATHADEKNRDAARYADEDARDPLTGSAKRARTEKRNSERKNMRARQQKEIQGTLTTAAPAKKRTGAR